jgi:glycosyltransferase involved in cell wall biosynthesis
MRSRKTFIFHLGVLTNGGSRLYEAELLVNSVFSLQRSENASWAVVSRLPYYFWKVTRESEKKKIKIIHTFGCFSDLIGLVVGKRLGATVINGSIRSARPKLTSRDYLSRICMRYCDRIVANSKAGLLAFGVTTGDDKSRVIHNGVDLNRFNNIKSMPKPEDFVICMIANFTRKKDHAALIGIVPMLQKKIYSLAVVLVGRGELLDSARRLISDLHLDRIVTIVSDCDHPEPFIASADLCLLLTNSSVHGEGISNSILEYMALEKPVIATDCGGNRELVVHGQTGYLVSDNNPALLIQHIFEIFNDRENGKLLGRNGRKKLEQEFELNVMVDNYQKLYEQITVTHPRDRKLD